MVQKKLDIAITYAGRVAMGRNPINNKKIPNDSVINNPNVIRCMYFIKETLENYKIDKFKRKFDYSLLENYKYEEDKIIT